ncbi:MAG: hypothetical protein AVDCRST_MAG66-719 [uncultured Pseudonocardia sp.]|uniref:Uncharacterized protein n=1 Tax=uncultured Pseudonocardia sp. TaxID=211455 RepID=A0A6J4NKG6_9PSEU|nr:MAG: hypothetical protein AVDCRST_MAG66-719 [uncultured Pseudonocardia sp.]
MCNAPHGESEERAHAPPVPTAPPHPGIGMTRGRDRPHPNDPEEVPR